VDSRCFVLSRANKSVRNFEAVVSALAEGRQPDLDAMAKVGYAAEMFSCWMIRHFSLMQAEHVAAARAPQTAVKMTDEIKRYVGIGNATGLGMAPYLINHPLLINNWMDVRETALARVLSGPTPDDKSRGDFECLAMKAMQHLDEISTDNADQNRLNANARADLERALAWVRAEKPQDWRALTEYTARELGVEAQELINVLLTLRRGLFLSVPSTAISCAVCRPWRGRATGKFALIRLIWMCCRFIFCAVSCPFLGSGNLIQDRACGYATPCSKARH